MSSTFFGFEENFKHDMVYKIVLIHLWKNLVKVKTDFSKGNSEFFNSQFVTA